MSRGTAVYFPDDIKALLIERAASAGFYGPSALSNYYRHAILEHSGIAHEKNGVREFSITYDSLVAAQTEQHAYGKTGKGVREWLYKIAEESMSRNGLSARQYERVVKKYGEATVVSPGGVGVPLGDEKT